MWVPSSASSHLHNGGGGGRGGGGGGSNNNNNSSSNTGGLLSSGNYGYVGGVASASPLMSLGMHSNHGTSSSNGLGSGLGAPLHVDRSQEVCKYYINGGCQRTNCPFMHEVPDERHLDTKGLGFILNPNVQNAQPAVSANTPGSLSTNNNNGLHTPVSQSQQASSPSLNPNANTNNSSQLGGAGVPRSVGPQSFHSSFALKSNSNNPTNNNNNNNNTNSNNNNNNTNSNNNGGKSRLAASTSPSAHTHYNPVMGAHHHHPAAAVSHTVVLAGLPNNVLKSTPPPRYRPPEPYLEHNLPPVLVLPIKSTSRDVAKVFLGSLFAGGMPVPPSHNNNNINPHNMNNALNAAVSLGSGNMSSPVLLHGGGGIGHSSPPQQGSSGPPPQGGMLHHHHPEPGSRF